VQSTRCFYQVLIKFMGYAMVKLVEALRYKPEGRGFDLRILASFEEDSSPPPPLKPAAEASSVRMQGRQLQEPEA
jgi:hypothetical protein